MSLVFFAVKNNYYKNGIFRSIQVFGGSQKCWIGLSDNKIINPSESAEELCKIKFIISGSTCSTDASFKVQI